MIKTQLKVLLTLAFLNPLVNMVMNLSVAAILWYGARDVMEGAASPGSIMAAITYTTQLLMGIMMLMMLFQNISRGFISWKRLATVLHLEESLKTKIAATFLILVLKMLTQLDNVQKTQQK